MNTNVNLAAPVGGLAFLGTGFLFHRGARSDPIADSEKARASKGRTGGSEGEWVTHFIIGHETARCIGRRSLKSIYRPRRWLFLITTA